MCVHPKQRNWRVKGSEDKGAKQPTVGTLGRRRNSPSAPSNEPHTSPVPGYEAVEATRVATVGAIEPVCLPHNVRRQGHQTRKGEGGPRCGNAGPFECPATETHRLEFPDDLALQEQLTVLVCVLCVFAETEGSEKFCRRLNFMQNCTKSG